MHDSMIKLGQLIGSNFLFRKITALFFNYTNPRLCQNLAGLIFNNPVGLAGGFDKDAKLTKILPSVGFGFMEVGSITAQHCAGNPKPWLWRLPKSKSIVVYYGLKNEGADKLAGKLRKRKNNQIPLGINIAKTNSPDTVETEKGKEDYLYSIKALQDVGDYLTINISCPNAYGGLTFAEPDSLKLLLEDMGKIKINKPIFLKLSPDIPWEKVDQIIDLAKQYGITGFICTNLTKNRDNTLIDPKELNLAPLDRGGISGKPLAETANKMIAYVYQKTQGQKIIIGCGGIFNAADAYKKIKLGASLVQLITGMIFEGPQMISQINLGLVQLLEKDGYQNISEAVGADFKDDARRSQACCADDDERRRQSKLLIS